MITKIEEIKRDIVFLNGEIPTDLPNDSLISINRDQPEKVYGLGFQPAKSIPEISRWFLTKYLTKNSIICEPFAGSGTTIIETLKFGATVYWLDYNPLSKLICRVKTSALDYTKAKSVSHDFIQRIQKQKDFKDSVYFSNKEFWFQKPVIEMLEIIKENINLLDKELHSVYWLAFSLTVRKMSDMNDSMILAARRPNVKEVPKRTKEDVVNCYANYLKKTIEAVEEWSNLLRQDFKGAKEISDNDARNFNGKWKCDAVLTSPPYINAMDYVWASKFELHWLGFVANNEARLNLYSKEIGTERITSEEYKVLGRTGNDHLDKIIEDIYYGKEYKASAGQNQLRARVVYKYFEDMKKHFMTCHEHLNRKGYYCFTVGDFSRICGVNVPVASLLAGIAKEIGFKEIFRFHLLLKKRKLNVPRNVDWANTIKHDTTIVLEKE